MDAPNYSIQWSGGLVKKAAGRLTRKFWEGGRGGRPRTRLDIHAIRFDFNISNHYRVT